MEGKGRRADEVRSRGGGAQGTYGGGESERKGRMYPFEIDRCGHCQRGVDKG